MLSSKVAYFCRTTLAPYNHSSPPVAYAFRNLPHKRHKKKWLKENAQRVGHFILMESEREGRRRILSLSLVSVEIVLILNPWSGEVRTNESLRDHPQEAEPNTGQLPCVIYRKTYCYPTNIIHSFKVSCLTAVSPPPDLILHECNSVKYWRCSSSWCRRRRGWRRWASCRHCSQRRTQSWSRRGRPTVRWHCSSGGHRSRPGFRENTDLRAGGGDITVF